MAHTAPALTFTNAVASGITGLAYVFSTLGSNFLPVLQGKSSLNAIFRVYNNYALNSGIASATNVIVTVYDGVTTASHTAFTQLVSQSWVRIYESGYGENSTTTRIPYTAFPGSDTAIGGNPPGKDYYTVQVGSDGAYSDQVRAGTNYNGVGYLEFTSYIQVPAGVSTQVWNFALDVGYEWTP